MVFYDRTGIRRIAVITGALIAFAFMGALLVLGFAHIEAAASATPTAYTHPDTESERLAKTVVLTFDDGPEPEHTEELIEVLRAENVPAAFFLLGENVVRYPELARTITENGFEIGNHSFTHSRRVHSSERRIRRELVAADRAIADATGYTTTLYRPPFLLDIDLGEVDGARVAKEPLRWAESAGYVVVGANVDSRDWDVPDGASREISEQLLSQIHDGANVLLLHDHGGSGATVEAVRELIPLLKERGYRFITLAEYFNVPASAFMHPASFMALDGLVVGGIKAYILGFSWLELMIVAVSALALSRLWIILLLRKGYVPFIRRKRSYGARRPVSVLIPAYNEEANIEATLRSVLREINGRDEVIVVDDGSTDDTAKIVERMQDDFGGRLILLRKENSGSKGGALAVALQHATRGVLVCIDADTVIGPDALDKLARHFDDTSIGAVAGKIYPASHRSVLAAFQYLEYIQGQNLDKEVFSALNATSIVPGAIGAWRRKAVMRVGGYSPDTVVEDQDLTLALLADSWRVIYDRDAYAFTETPSTAKGLFRQRSRWVFGTMQCAWKYRGHFFSWAHPALGWIVLPNVLLFNIVLPLLIPIIDGAVIAGLFGQLNLSSFIVPVLVYLAFDIWFTLEALTYEKKPPYRLIVLIIWQRWYYRYLMALVSLRSVAYALQGYLMRWGTHQRRGDCHSALEEFAPALPSAGVPVSAPPATSVS